MIRAAAALTDDEIVVIGSQSIFGLVTEPPDALTESMEADLAHGVGPETPVPPAGWQGRLLRREFPPTARWKHAAVAWFLEPHDLVLAKLAAGRPNDLAFATEAIRAQIVDLDMLRRGLELMPESHRGVTSERLELAVSRL